MNSRHPALAAALLPLLLLVPACAGDRFGTRTQTWGEAGDSDYVEKTQDQPAAKKMTAREYASRFNTAGECELEARRVDTRDKKGGAALFHACLERDDFLDLEPFYTAPWRTLLGDEKGMIELGRVIANRGGWVLEDLTAMQQQNVDVLFLSQAVEQPAQARGKALITRLRYLEPRKEVPGQLVFEEATLSPEEPDYSEEAPAAASNDKYPSTLTGQRVVLELPGDKGLLTRGDELIVVGELLGTETVRNQEVDEDQEWAVVRVLGRFQPEDRLRD